MKSHCNYNNMSSQHIAGLSYWGVISQDVNIIQSEFFLLYTKSFLLLCWVSTFYRFHSLVYNILVFLFL